MTERTTKNLENEDKRLIKTALNKLAKCPVCGYLLGFLPWGPFGESASHEICPCCGIEFGYHDDALLEDPKDRQKVWDEWRKHWIEGGMKWWSKAREPPENWNPVVQLKNVGC